jgi:hypothetical protein
MRQQQAAPFAWCAVRQFPRDAACADCVQRLLVSDMQRSSAGRRSGRTTIIRGLCVCLQMGLSKQQRSSTDRLHVGCTLCRRQVYARHISRTQSRDRAAGIESSVCSWECAVCRYAIARPPARIRNWERCKIGGWETCRGVLATQCGCVSAGRCSRYEVPTALARPYTIRQDIPAET